MAKPPIPLKRAPTGPRGAGSFITHLPGKRTVKEYPITGEELATLGILQGGSALALAACGACFGFWVSTEQTVAFADRDVSAETIGWWTGLAAGALWLAAILAVVGVALIVISGIKVWRIKRYTEHGPKR